MSRKVKIREFYGKDEYSDRIAYLYLDSDDSYLLEFIKKTNGKITHKECKTIKDHSIYFAEDAAENWTTGVIQHEQV